MISQPAIYVFKLRSNIVLEGDATLAKMELRAFLPGELQKVDNLNALGQRHHQLTSIQGISSLGSHTRREGTQGYITEAPLELVIELVKRVSFIQHIYCLTENTDHAKRVLKNFEDSAGPVIVHSAALDTITIQAIPHCALLELSDTAVKLSSSPHDTKKRVSGLLSALTGTTDEMSHIKLAEKALGLKSTTSHLGHDIHYYKAKFFPRLARSLINICERNVPDGQHRVMDNFVGSGTTLLEASMLGIPSIGIDIDPLAVLISKAKLESIRLESATVNDEATRAKEFLTKRSTHDGSTAQQILFPEWLMKNRKMSDGTAADLSREIMHIRSAIGGCNNPQVSSVLRVAMSDAIARKVKMRFLGTGVGRFSLTFAKASITDMFCKSMERYSKTTAVSEWMRDELNTRPAEAQVLTGDAKLMPDEAGMFDILVTSPPYVPASSGRESYARARAPSLIALGLEDARTVDDLADGSVGSMSNNNADLTRLTTPERRIVDWLQTDELRSIKAKPTAQYFLDIRQSFEEMRRMMSPGGMAIVVSGKESTFYEFSTRRTLLVVHSAELLADEAQRAGFTVESLHDVKLNKSNKNARPRSLDDYYETLVVLRNTNVVKPATSAPDTYLPSPPQAGKTTNPDVPEARLGHRRRRILETVVHRERRGTSHGVSIRVSRSLYYWATTFRSHPIERAETVHADAGLLGLTTKHVYFAGSWKKFRVRYDRIVSFGPHDDGFGIIRDAQTAKPQTFITGEGWFVYNLAVNLSQM